MQTRHKFLLIVGGSLLCATLAWLSVRIELSLIDYSGRQGFGFFGSGILYVLAPIVGGLVGLFLSISLLKAVSLRQSIMFSVPFSLVLSLGSFKEIFSILTSDQFDTTYFKMSLFAICSSFVIYPLVALLFWKTKQRLTQRYQ